MDFIAHTLYILQSMSLYTGLAVLYDHCVWIYESILKTHTFQKKKTKKKLLQRQAEGHNFATLLQLINQHSSFDLWVRLRIKDLK